MLAILVAEELRNDACLRTSNRTSKCETSNDENWGPRAPAHTAHGTHALHAGGSDKDSSGTA